MSPDSNSLLSDSKSFLGCNVCFPAVLDTFRSPEGIANVRKIFSSHIGLGCDITTPDGDSAGEIRGDAKQFVEEHGSLLAADGI